MNKTKHSLLVSSLVLLTIFLSNSYTSAQIPRPYLKFVEAQNKVQSGYVKLHHIYVSNNDTTFDYIEKAFFIATPKDVKYLIYSHADLDVRTYCKSAHAIGISLARKDFDYLRYAHNDQIHDAKEEIPHLSFPLKFSEKRLKTATFQKIPPKINNKNIRYKIIYPNDDTYTNHTNEKEFDSQTLYCVQSEFSAIYFKTEKEYGKTDILEYRLYDYIHPDILDTISFKYEEMKKAYDQQCVVEQAQRDSAYREHLCDSIRQIFVKDGGAWVETMPRDTQQETRYVMPDWKFPLLGGDSIRSKDIHSRFLLIDMWYISCHPCRLAMRDLAAIDTLYDKSLLKMLSLNIGDKDTVKMRQVVESLNVHCNVACTFDSNHYLELSKKMGGCQGYPQIYLIDMQTKEVIWRSCGWREGLAKEIEESLRIGN